MSLTSTASRPNDFLAFHNDSRHQAECVLRASVVYPPSGSLAFSVRDAVAAFTYHATDQGIEISAGHASAKTVVELNHETWCSFRDGMETTQSLVLSNRASITTGNILDFSSWGPVLEALYQGRPPYEAKTIAGLGVNGKKLDPHSSFSAESPKQEMHRFLHATGYLRVRNAISAPRVGRLRETAARLKSAAREGDGLSWWGTDKDGQSRLFRVHNAALEPEIQDLRSLDVVRRLLELADDEMIAPDYSEIHSSIILWKRPGMIEGLSDLPWHRDCQLGGHAENCPTLVMSVHLYPVSKETGDLRFLPGSHHGAFCARDATLDIAGSISIGAESGDITLHYSDVVHMAPPPTSQNGPHRASIVTMYRKRDARNHRGDRHYFDSLEAGDGHIKSEASPQVDSK